MVPPFLWMISTSLKLPTQVSAYPPEWIPDPITLASYREVWRSSPSADLREHHLRSFAVMFLELLTFRRLAGYAFARIRSPVGAPVLLYLGTLMVPARS